MRKIWKEIQGGSEWIVDADLRDSFGSVDHEKHLALVAQQIPSSPRGFVESSRKLHTANLSVQFGRRTEARAQARLLRPD
jgi:hypothetical protein